MATDVGPHVPERIATDLAELVARNRARYATAPEFVLATLREAILDGHVPPGSRLRQEELATAFGISRIPVREALRVLEHEGLARSERHRGYTVATLDAEELESIYDLRIVLEGHAVRRAIPLLTPSDIEDLTALHGAMESAHEAYERLASHERFYDRLYAVTANPRLTSLITRMRHEVPRSLRWRVSQDSPHHHDAFFAAVKAGDADLAVIELSARYHKVLALLRRYLREAKAGS